MRPGGWGLVLMCSGSTTGPAAITTGAAGLTLLVDEPDAGVAPQLKTRLEGELPETYRGYPVRFPVTGDGSRAHWVEVATVAGFAASRRASTPGACRCLTGWS